MPNPSPRTGMVEHTPGPWRIERKDGGMFNVVAGHDYFTRTFVAFMGANPEEGDTEANARLIAAAPELLEALEAMVATSPIDDEVLPQVLAAIARAKGIAQHTSGEGTDVD